MGQVMTVCRRPRGIFVGVNRRRAKRHTRTTSKGENERQISAQQFETAEVVLLPCGIADHCSQGSNRKCVAEEMIRDDYSSAVGVPVDAVTSANSLKDEAVCLEGLNELAGGDAPRQPGHTLTATVGVGNSSVPCSGSTGMGSPAARRSSTYSSTASRMFAKASS